MIGIEIDGLRQLESKLQQLSGKYGSSNQVSATVSQSAQYAIYVHEDLEAGHNVGEAKFLEKAALRNKDKVAERVTKMLPTTKMSLALYSSALLIQRDSMKLTPVDTGNLKASAQTEIEKR